MPVILDGEAAEHWMFSDETDADVLRKLLTPASDDLLVGTPVSDRANSVKNDDPSVLDEAPTLL
jgi:putative SOS response-associated peptidase YedK